ncbi:GDSL esterase/lipase At1g71250-like [Malania oleifera]|uniref:GDSL esterase/lipase At1g71250-like n=1 Tax=Malania oleifera TaxID=397392 RepID=UPI0025ADEB9C|nr:GDSL esterase/lipase At1g71250-like [Malania oleifera]
MGGFEQNSLVEKARRRRRTREMVLVLLLLLLVAVFPGKIHARRPVENGSSSGRSVSALFVLGDSSVDCGDNTLFYPLLRRNLSLHPCNGSDTTLLPHLLAKKMGLPYTPAFYAQNGTIEGLLAGLNFGSAQATIMNINSQNHQSLDQQVRQAFETFQLLQLHLGQDYAYRFIKSSFFYLSFGKDDYINLLFRNPFGVRRDYGDRRFAHIMVNQMANVVRNLYNVNVRKIVCMGTLPLGCTPRMVWKWYNFTGGDDDGRGCVEGINQLVLDYNTLLEGRIAELNMEFPDAQIVFCDVYQGIMQILSNPKFYGFENARSACCGLGWYGGMSGCASMEMACPQASTHVWWDFYNPSQAVNSLLADSAWSGQPLTDICRPSTVREMVSTAGASFLM